MKSTLKQMMLVHMVGNELAAQMALEIQDWLRKNGCISTIFQATKNTSLEADWDNVDMVLTLGGDGTLLGVARGVLEREIPVLGLNLGKVGFLTELSPEDWQGTLEDIVVGQYALSSRLVVSFKVFRHEQEFYQGYAVNDLVISCGSLARMIRLNMWYGRDHLGMVRADGMIVATPTGSSGYSISAGGPLIYPELDVFALTPICPFLHAFRPMILPFEDDLHVEVLEADSKVYLTQDGQTGVVLRTGDKVIASRAQKRLLLVRPLHSHYAHKLKSKGFIRES
ncbi:MAG: NAD(+)/NADH kinase [Desulfovibrionales bacterium]|nr:NAD(+)/NADH kinase [Desulfovibrionales bacterium]